MLNDTALECLLVGVCVYLLQIVKQILIWTVFYSFGNFTREYIKIYH